MSAPVNQKASSGSHSFDSCRFIELDCVPMETGYMVSMRPSHGHMPHQSPERHRRRTAPQCSSRDPYGSMSVGSSTSGTCKGSDGSPTTRCNVKSTSCLDNHGIRPPPPEQYLTPLQQKELCIRHLRARLKENIEVLQDRESEIEELRTQLSRMQEDWIEEECHCVETQLALKEARREIQQLKHVVDVVRTNLCSREAVLGPTQQHLQDADTQSHTLNCLLRGLEEQRGGGTLPGHGGSRSWGGSPAQSLTRSSTYTKLSHEALLDPTVTGPEPGMSGEETQDSGFACGDSRADLLLETLLYEGLPSPSSLDPYMPLPRSFTYEKLCTCKQVVLQAKQVGQSSSSSQPCLPCHQLYLHHLQERAIQTDHVLLPPCHDHTKSQSCSPSSTWISEEGEDLDTVTMATTTINGVAPLTTPPAPYTVDQPHVANIPPQTCQPKGGGPPEEHFRVMVVEAAEGEGVMQEGSGAEGGLEALPPPKSYWSRHFLMDLLAVAVPVVPAVAWLCRGPRRHGQPVYNMGSLLRGCCALALHSLRRAGMARCGPVSGRCGTEI